MKPVTIRRYAEITGRSQDTASPAFTDHTYPFVEFGTLASHIHPRFVIVDSGRKMRRGMLSFRVTSVVPRKIKLMILQIYSNWTMRTTSPTGSSDGYDYNTSQNEPVHSPEVPQLLPYPNHKLTDLSHSHNEIHAGATNDNGALIDDEACYDSQRNHAMIQAWATNVHHLHDADPSEPFRDESKET